MVIFFRINRFYFCFIDNYYFRIFNSFFRNYLFNSRRCFDGFGFSFHLRRSKRNRIKLCSKIVDTFSVLSSLIIIGLHFVQIGQTFVFNIQSLKLIFDVCNDFDDIIVCKFAFASHPGICENNSFLIDRADFICQLFVRKDLADRQISKTDDKSFLRIIRGRSLCFFLYFFRSSSSFLFLFFSDWFFS